MPGPIRVLIAKPGLDGHDRGAKVIARGLRDAGMAVSYTGRHKSPDQIAEAALQEDVHAVGLSILSGAHNALVPQVLAALRARGLDDVVVVVGGIIPPSDAEDLTRSGVAAIFPPGSRISDVVAFIEAHAAQRS